MTSWAGNLVGLFSDRPLVCRMGGTKELAPSLETATIEGDLAAVLERLASSGIDRVVAVDLSRPALGVAAVRVIVPRLEGMRHKPDYRPGERALRARRTWT